MIVFIYALCIGDNPKHTIFTSLPSKRLLYRDVRWAHVVLNLTESMFGAEGTFATRGCGDWRVGAILGHLGVASEYRQDRFRIAHGKLAGRLHL